MEEEKREPDMDKAAAPVPQHKCEPDPRKTRGRGAFTESECRICGKKLWNGGASRRWSNPGTNPRPKVHMSKKERLRLRKEEREA